MTTINDIATNLNNYDINSFIIENCEVINFKYLSKKISNFNPHCLYIFKSSNLPDEIISHHVINFLIIKDKPLPKFLNNKCNYIILNNFNMPIYKLIYIVQDIFNINTSLISFQKDVINAIGNNQTIDEIMKISFFYLKNPIILLNSMYHTCSYYIGDINIDDESWKYQLSKGIPHPTYSLLYNKDKKNRKLTEDKKEIITTYFPEIMKYKEITVPIRHNNLILARISILECNNVLNDFDLEILKALGKLIYPLLLSDHRFIKETNSHFNTIMTYLLSTDKPNDIWVKNSLSSLNIDNSSNLYLLILKDDDNINSKTKIAYVQQYISSLFSNHIVFTYENSIIIIFNNKNSYEKFYKCKEYKNFVEAIRNYTLKVGVSKLFNNLLKLKTAYCQCIKAISFGEATEKKEEPIYYFNDYINLNLVFSFLQKENLNNILDPKLKNLILSNNNDLYYTLYTYVKCNYDTKQTSQSLNIHYNTLKYRLQKIKDLYEMNLDDEDYLIKLELSFMALSSKKIGGIDYVCNNE